MLCTCILPYFALGEKLINLSGTSIALRPFEVPLGRAGPGACRCWPESPFDSESDKEMFCRVCRLGLAVFVFEIEH